MTIFVRLLRENLRIVNPSSPGANRAIMRLNSYDTFFLFWRRAPPLSTSGYLYDVYLSSWRFTSTKTILTCFSSLSNLQSGAATQRQKKTQDTVNRAESTRTDCIICSENVATVTFNPCGHKVLCSGKTIQNRQKKPSALRMAREALFIEAEPAWLAGLARSCLVSS